MFDHLWPMGDPTRPALSAYPILAATAARTTRVALGTLVARIGLVPDEVVLASLLSLVEITQGRLIAGLGTGDQASQAEHERLGLPYFSASERRESLRAIAREMKTRAAECWIGAGATVTNDVARELGVALNFWDVPAERLKAEVAAGSIVSWGGPLPKTTEGASAALRKLSEAGATWVVWGWPRSLEAVVEASEAAGITQGVSGPLPTGG